MKQFVIIVAGGSGTRMKTEIPKQFIELNGEALIILTIKKFLQYNSSINIILVVHQDFKIFLEALLLKSKISIQNIQITIGGETRFHSVLNGLNLISELNAIVGIHDAARPFVSLKTITKCFEQAELKGNAVPCIGINDSIRYVNGNENSIANRNDFKIIQTPQCFLISKIKNAFKQNYNPSFTDDASVLESSGEKINLVEGNIENIKITTPFDLIIANAFSKYEQ